jgi:hypothetical protein
MAADGIWLRSCGLHSSPEGKALQAHRAIASITLDRGAVASTAESVSVDLNDMNFV